LQFELGVHEAVPAAMNPEPILRGIRANGYYVWSDASGSPSGTTQ
jgi:hypothetical protein